MTQDQVAQYTFMHSGIIAKNNSCRWSNPEGYTRILIPKSLQADVLQQLHYARQRAEECKLGAKGSVFWVNINRDKEEMVKFRAPLEQLNLINN